VRYARTRQSVILTAVLGRHRPCHQWHLL